MTFSPLIEYGQNNWRSTATSTSLCDSGITCVNGNILLESLSPLLVLKSQVTMCGLPTLKGTDGDLQLLKAASSI